MKQLCDQSAARQTSHSRSHQGLAAVHRITTVKSVIIFRLGSNYQLPFWAVRGDVKLLRQLSSFFNFQIWRLPSHFPTFTSTYTISRWRFYLPKFCQICEETKSESQRFYSCQSVFIKILNFILISYKSLNHLGFFWRQDFSGVKRYQHVGKWRHLIRRNKWVIKQSSEWVSDWWSGGFPTKFATKIIYYSQVRLEIKTGKVWLWSLSCQREGLRC